MLITTMIMKMVILNNPDNDHDHDMKMVMMMMMMINLQTNL